MKNTILITLALGLFGWGWKIGYDYRTFTACVGNFYTFYSFSKKEEFHTHTRQLKTLAWDSWQGIMEGSAISTIIFRVRHRPSVSPPADSQLYALQALYIESEKPTVDKLRTQVIRKRINLGVGDE